MRVLLAWALLLAACGDDTEPMAPADAPSPGTDGATAADAPPGSPDAGPLRLLVFSRTTGYRHASIPDGIAALRDLFALDATEDPATFRDEALAPYDVIVFLCTTGDVLDDDQQGALERWVRGGGGWVGVHSASDTEYDWPFYGELVGAWFADHPAIQGATLHVEDASHPATADLPDPWLRTDEWYNFRENPRGDVDVLVTLDEGTYDGGTMGDHPIAWSRAIDAGRAFYTAGGHTSESYGEAAFRAHLAGAIRWAGRR